MLEEGTLQTRKFTRFIATLANESMSLATRDALGSTGALNA